MNEEQSKGSIIYSGAIFTIFVFLLIQLYYFQTKPEISQTFTSTYIPLAWIGVVFSAIMIIFAFRREPATANLTPPLDQSSYRLIRPTWLKISLVVLFSLTILFSVTTLKVQVLPIPQPLNTGFSVSPITETYLISVIPAMLEDFTYFWLLPQIIFNLLWIVFYFVLEKDVRESTGSYFAVMLIAILIASLGTSIFIPGFTQAHSEVYQANQEAYISAFIFGFIQSLIYMITGFFFPLAHIIHNALFSLGFVVALSIGGANITGIIFSLIKSQSIMILPIMKLNKEKFRKWFYEKR